jgi:hypothetical protein
MALCTSDCCRFPNALPVKLCTAGNSLENRVPEYLAVTSRCVGRQECQQIFFPSGNIQLFERAEHIGRLNEASLVAGPCCNECLAWNW